MIATSSKNKKYAGVYSYAPAHKTRFRSGLEDKIAEQIKSIETTLNYENFKLNYEIPATQHTYTPDFILKNGIVVEGKGIFDSDDRAKHILIKKQYPHLDIRFVFSNPNNKIYKGSKTTYAIWCEKYGFKYASKLIPSSWFKEPKKDTKGLIKKNKT